MSAERSPSDSTAATNEFSPDELADDSFAGDLAAAWRRKGGMWPALTRVSLNESRSRTATTKVTKRPSPQVWIMAELSLRTAPATVGSVARQKRAEAERRAMSSAAGTPLPETSPKVMARRLPGRVM